MENSNKEILAAIKMLSDKMDNTFKVINDKLDKFEDKLDMFEDKLDMFEDRLDRFEDRLDTLEKKVDSIQEEVADTKEWRTELNSKLDSLLEVKAITKQNCYDIARLRSI
ncbi:hypothetical protein [Clostridium sp.]|uniref:hypothetical protein n=1 Tax=Clostridium sp. TaxID=1506 RepID=UPI001B4718A0|nr:hypothetical protein [Clostridium sp.]MBP3916027.1 hypothetical protein [Clostridium sp.]